jgi:hypothetical protein
MFKKISQFQHNWICVLAYNPVLPNAPAPAAPLVQQVLLVQVRDWLFTRTMTRLVGTLAD